MGVERASNVNFISSTMMFIFDSNGTIIYTRESNEKSVKVHSVHFQIFFYFFSHSSLLKKTSLNAKREIDHASFEKRDASRIASIAAFFMATLLISVRVTSDRENIDD